MASRGGITKPPIKKTPKKMIFLNILKIISPLSNRISFNFLFYHCVKIVVLTNEILLIDFT
ncbi:hypothetical protein HpCHC60_03310 [Helicobacter pylori]|nr:hypothetical protein VN0438_05580 [Helicobacter pylori]